jgi:phosphate:Na+ symporter
VLWRLENEISERHIRAFRDRRDDGGAGDVYLRILRDLKRIHSHLAALAYPVLERAGLLQDRLVREAAPAASTPH